MTKDRKCNTNNIHEFMENNKYGYDTTQNKIVNFNYFDFERRVINHIMDNDLSIIKKSRQMYMSTLLSAFSVWSILEKKEDILFICCDKQMYRMVMNKIRIMLDKIEPHIKYNKKTTDEIIIPNKGSIKLSMVDINHDLTAFNGNIIIDEAAFLKYNSFDKFLREALFKRKPNKKIIISSTPNGIRDEYKETTKLNYFFELYHKTDFAPLSINYKDNPNFSNKTWYNNIKKLIPENKFKQEVYGEFIQIEPKPKPKSKNKNNLIQFRVDDNLYAALSSKLIRNDINVSTYMRDLIIKDMDK